jgi:hypothetical protein
VPNEPIGGGGTFDVPPQTTRTPKPPPPPTTTTTTDDGGILDLIAGIDEKYLIIGGIAALGLLIVMSKK